MTPEDDRFMPQRDRRTDLVLLPRQFAYIQRLTEGALAVYVGPYRASLSETECLIVSDPKTGQPKPARDQNEAIKAYIDVAEGDYAVLVNPVRGGDNQWPESKKSNDLPELAIGRQVNLPGPLSFALWPFQTVRSIKGHTLQMNQYLVVRVINDEEAMKNWDKAIVKAQVAEGEQNPAIRKSVPRPDNLSVGQLILIKGTEVSFYIPPTGLEVVADARGEYIREAVTLEQLEYCVLTDQDGKRRIEQGPQVVFPKPSETFTEINDGGIVHRKFRAIELTEISGVHIKVTAEYEEGGVKYKVGDELFITGKDQPIYFPRTEHAIVKYDGREVHFATAVPKGEGRYVLDRFNGVIKLVTGPQMLLPDPRTQVFTRRILSPKQVELWFPGNREALRVNEELTQQALLRGVGTTDYLSDDTDSDPTESVRLRGLSSQRYASASTRFAGDDMNRKSTYTPPRTVTLNSKYDGAVTVEVFTGYAVLVVNRSGERRIVEGPQTILLEFDETLATMALSTGKPKTTDTLFETAYLRVNNNLVSDIISVETADSVSAKVKVSYRVNFTGPKEKWFDVENYVKVLCDHARSIIRNMVRKVGIQEFNVKYIDMIRDTLLGKPEGVDGEKKKRTGLVFEENGMVVFDVEVLALEIGDGEISELLIEAQHEAVKASLEAEDSKRRLELARDQARIDQETEQLKTETALKKLKLQQQAREVQLGLDAVNAQKESEVALMKLNLNKSEVTAKLDVALLALAAETEEASKRLGLTQEKEKIADFEDSAQLAREKARSEQDLETAKAKATIELERIIAETTQLAERTKALTPEMVAALQTFGDKAMVEKMASAMAPLAILGGTSVVDILGQLLKGSGLEQLVSQVATGMSKRSAGGE